MNNTKNNILEFTFIPNYFIYNNNLYYDGDHQFYFSSADKLSFSFKGDTIEIFFIISCWHCDSKKEINVIIDCINCKYTINGLDKITHKQFNHTFSDYKQRLDNKYINENKNELDNFNFVDFKKILFSAINDVFFKSTYLGKLVRKHNFTISKNIISQCYNYYNNDVFLICLDCNLQLSARLKHKSCYYNEKIQLDKPQIQFDYCYYTLNNKINNFYQIDHDYRFMNIKKLSCDQIIVQNILT